MIQLYNNRLHASSCTTTYKSEQSGDIHEIETKITKITPKVLQQNISEDALATH